MRGMDAGPGASLDDRGGPLLEIERLRIGRASDRGTRTIVSGVDLSLEAGETIGIVGESGSGKSMTAKAITGLLPPGVRAEGRIRYRGRDLIDLRERDWRAVRGREIGMILQDPFTMLNPVMRCGRILEESLPGSRRARRGERREEIPRRLAEVGITDESVQHRYPFQLSGGMRQRIGIAAALARDPRVLIADEPSTALDVATQRQVLALIKNIQQERGMGLILITHDLRVAFSICDRIYVLYAGSLLEAAPAAEMGSEPLHPYTRGLLLSEPPADHRVRDLVAIPGAVPTPDEVSDRCAFAPRCEWAQEICRSGVPSLREVAGGRMSACIRIEEIRGELRSADESPGFDVHVAEPDRVAPLVSVHDIHKDFVSGGRTTTALDGVSIQLGPGESVGVVGESGSGKTTLGRMLVGLERPTRGEIVIDGIDLNRRKPLTSREWKKVRSTVQIVFQDPYSSLNPMRSVGWTLSEAVATQDGNARHLDRRVADLLESVGLPGAYAQRRPASLSGGERQRIAIARALAMKPQVLICDEAVSALDMSVQAQILKLLISLRAESGIGYLFITHDLAIVRQIVDFLYVMSKGQVVEAGPTEQVLDRPTDEYTVQLMQSVPRAERGWLEAAGPLDAGIGELGR